jgi:urea carboxylase-associated protein 2
MTIPGGAYWTAVVPRWSTLRIVDVVGAGSGSCLFFNARQPSERYNAPDTVKIQNQIFLTTGDVLFSDMGRILMAITADTCGHHDTLAGATNATTTAKRYGPTTYLEARNEYHRNDRDNFIAALGRHGLGRRDIVPTFNLWNRVTVGADGTLQFVPGCPVAHGAIDLRAEMPVLAVISNTPHVLDPAPEYRPGPLHLSIWESPPPTADDVCRTGTPERQRGTDNSDALAAAESWG